MKAMYPARVAFSACSTDRPSHNFRPDSTSAALMKNGRSASRLHDPGRVRVRVRIRVRVGVRVRVRVRVSVRVRVRVGRVRVRVRVRVGWDWH